MRRLFVTFVNNLKGIKHAMNHLNEMENAMSFPQPLAGSVSKIGDPTVAGSLSIGVVGILVHIYGVLNIMRQNLRSNNISGKQIFRWKHAIKSLRKLAVVTGHHAVAESARNLNNLLALFWIQEKKCNNANFKCNKELLKLVRKVQQEIMALNVPDPDDMNSTFSDMHAPLDSLMQPHRKVCMRINKESKGKVDLNLDSPETELEIKKFAPLAIHLIYLLNTFAVTKLSYFSKNPAFGLPMCLQLEPENQGITVKMHGPLQGFSSEVLHECVAKNGIEIHEKTSHEQLLKLFLQTQFAWKDDIFRNCGIGAGLLTIKQDLDAMKQDFSFSIQKEQNLAIQFHWPM